MSFRPDKPPAGRIPEVDPPAAAGKARPAVSVSNLGKCYKIYGNPRDRIIEALSFGRRRLHREFWALRDVSVEVAKGETLGIIGRNGSGKSTLLQMICGTLAPTVGEARISGRVAALLELGAGFNPEFTGKENVYMNASILGLSKERIDEKYADILEFADIGQFIDQPVKMYSSGMYVRLAFAIAANADADILVIDEALAVGDAFFVQKCMRFLREFKARGTLIFVSHDTAAVVNLCARAVLLDGGLVRAVGPAKDVCDLYLETLYADRQDVSRVRNGSGRNQPDAESESQDVVDQRLKYVNCSEFRNDIKIFPFNEKANSFGKGEAFITAVGLLDRETLSPLTWAVGGEKVVLSVRCRTEVPIERPLIGFYVRDRLGQTLFGDNTYLTTIDDPVSVGAGSFFEATFCFRMPVLPIGDYSVTVALAAGTQEDHEQHHWMHDAVLFKSHSSSVCTGLVGLPMERVDLYRIGE